MTQITKEQFNRAKSDFKGIVGEEGIEVSFHDNAFMVLCSELAMYRLLSKYNFGYIVQRNALDTSFKQNLNISHGYSVNLKSFYFRIETEFDGAFNGL